MRNPHLRLKGIVSTGALFWGCTMCLFLGFMSLSCQPEVKPLDLPTGCQPLLAGFDCMLPYPSDFFLVKDGSLPAGVRIEMETPAQLNTKEGRNGDVTNWREADGYSTVPAIVAVLGTAVAGGNLVGIFDDYDLSTRSQSPTRLFDAKTLQPIAHFADLDPRATDPKRQGIVIRPMVGLVPRHRYIVAISGLRQPDGRLARPPEGFRRLRDAEVGTEEVMQQLLDRYEKEIFPQLKKVGVRREELQLAWDFSVGSQEHIITDMLQARALALQYLQQSPPQVLSMVAVEDEQANLWRRVVGRIRGPLVMEHAAPGADLFRDSDGNVALNGTTEFTFTVMVPASVRDGFEPGLALEFGHGFFGSQSEVEGGGARRIGDTLRAVSFAADWWGMSSVDMGVVVSALGDHVYDTMDFSDRVIQGMVNRLVLSAAIQGPLRDEPTLRRPLEIGAPGVWSDPVLVKKSNAGQLLYDPDRVHFLGISQGHILGGIYIALNPNIERACLHAGGAGFVQMMFRAQPFAGFLYVMELAMPDPLDQQKLAASLQMQFDRIDPASFAPFVLRRELPFGPPGGFAKRQVLLQGSVADTHVPLFTQHLHARLLGIPALSASVYVPWGLESIDAPYRGSAVTVFDMGEDDSFSLLAQPPEVENPVHTGLRVQAESMEQMRRFFYDGLVVDPCGGLCEL